MQIIELDDNDSHAWNSLALSNQEVRFYQLFEYRKVLEEVFNYKSFYLLFKDNETVIGQLPLFLIKTFLFNKIESIPFSEYGGVVSDCPQKLDFPMIRAYLSDLMKKNKADYLEMNAGLGLPESYMKDNFKQFRFHDYAEVELDSEETVWDGLDYQVRKAVNKAVRSGITVFEDNSEKGIKKYFYPLFLRSLRRHATPPVSLSYFLKCKEYFNDGMKIFFAVDSAKVVASLLGFVSGARVYLQLIVSDERAHDKRPVDLVHWEFIKWAIKNNFRFLDFGLARYEGQVKYKLKWGTSLKHYNYYYQSGLNFSEEKITEPLTPLSPKVAFLKKAWRLQLPFIQDSIGPWIRWNLAK